MRIGHITWSGQRLPVLPVVGTWGMFSKAKGSLRPVRCVVLVGAHRLMSDGTADERHCVNSVSLTFHDQ